MALLWFERRPLVGWRAGFWIFESVIYQAGMEGSVLYQRKTHPSSGEPMYLDVICLLGDYL